MTAISPEAQALIDRLHAVDHNELPGCGAQVIDVACGPDLWAKPYALPARAEPPRHDAARGRPQTAVAPAGQASTAGVGLVATQHGFAERWSRD
jgi:hypothetical protein